MDIERLDDGADFAALLRWCRRRAGLGQATLAELSGLGVRTIRDLELGRTSHPHRESVRLLADALGLEGDAGERFRRAAGHAPRAEPLHLPARPGQLPPDLADFTGRAEQLAALRGLLTAGARPAPAVVVLGGQPGAGKTALAVRAGHELESQFPHGCLHADLRGTGPAPLTPGAVLASFLRALGVDGADVPADVDGRVALYRSCTAGRRVLVLLDDAAAEAQVRPLLPSGAGCAALVTSRTRLAGLEAAVSLPVRLLGRVAGAARVAAEPAAATAIVERCAFLPLAVRIAGARLAGRPHWKLSRLTAVLDDDRRRLDELRAGDLNVRASIAVSYRLLGTDARTALRRIGLLDAPDFGVWAGAALVDAGVERAEHLCERLVEAHLLELAGEDAAGHARYRMPDLVRAFARERLLREESPDSRAEALRRVVDRGLQLADRVARLGGGPQTAGVSASGFAGAQARALAESPR